MAKDMSIVDIAWGLGFAALVIFQWVRWAPASPRSFLVGYLILIWGLRLAVFLAIRNLRKERIQDMPPGAMTGERIRGGSLISKYSCCKVHSC